MRFRHPDGSTVHLAYCTNVHPAEDLDGVLAQLDRYARAGAPARSARDGSASACGWPGRRWRPSCWPTPDGAPRLRAELAARGLEVVTLNAFPYRGFHAEVVKHAVYRPDWTDRGPAATTRWTAPGVLADAAARRRARTAASRPCRWPGARRGTTPPARPRPRALAELADGAGRAGRARPAGRSGSRLEPEPGCVVETTAEAVGPARAAVDPRWLGLCLDTCHLAVAVRGPGRRASAGSPRPGCRWSRCRCPARCRSTTADAAGPGRAGRLRRTALPAPGPERTADGGCRRRRPGRGAGRRPARTARPGGCTSTCRCTPQPDGAAAARTRPSCWSARWPSWSAVRAALTDAPRGRDVHLVGAAAGQRPAGDAGLVAGHRRRAGLDPGPRCGPTAWRRSR